MSEPERVRVIVVAGWPVVAAGIQQLLEPEEHVEVVGAYASLHEAIAGCERGDVVVVDPDCEQVSLRAVLVLAHAGKGRVLVFAAPGDDALHRRAIEMGASGVVSKDEAASVLARAIQRVHAGELWLDRGRTAAALSLARRRSRDPEAVKIESLTRREREIVGLVSQGLRNASIADRLSISEATVRNHLTSILSKLELSNRFDLAVYAFRHDLVTEPESVPLNGRPAGRPVPGHVHEPVAARLAAAR